MFLQLLKEIFNYSPLVLSDTTETKDVSLNRIMIVIEFILVVIISPVFLLYLKSKVSPLYDTTIDMWKLLLASFGVHLTINTFRKK